MKLNKLNFLIAIITINLNLFNKTLTYEIPKLTFELLTPKGFRVSIPDEPGIKLFAFQGAINRNILKPEPGDFSGVITTPTNEQWIYENPFITVLPKDTIYYWLHIQHDNKVYQKNSGTYPIGQALPYNESLISKIEKTTEIPINENYVIPIPKIQRLNPRGFRISIPDESGVKLFAFHGKLNYEIRKFEAGDFNQIISTPFNGEWIYENQEIEINRNDILNYWIHIQYGEKSLTLPVQSYQFEYDMISTLFGITKNRTIPIILDDNDNHHIYTVINHEYEISNSVDNICEESITTVTGSRKKICKGNLIFEDKFDTYDNQIWEKEIKFSGLDGEFVLYDDKPGNLYVADGKLNIIPSLTIDSEYEKLRNILNLGNRCTEHLDSSCQRNSAIPPVILSKIRTKKSFSFRYGKIDVRAKLPIGDWTFPQIFLEPLNHIYGEDYASGQIRIAFIRGNEFLENKEGEQIDGHRLYGGVIIDNNENLRDIWLKSTEIYPEHFGTDFHNYSLIWTNDYIRMEVDGIPYGFKIRGNFIKSAHAGTLKYSTAWTNGTKMAPFDQEFYISLGMAVGGYVDFPDGTINGPKHNKKPWKNLNQRSEMKFWNNRDEWKRTWTRNNTKLIVDYIRVYAL